MPAEYRLSEKDFGKAERIDLPTSGEAEDIDWLLEVFCPEESCEITSPTQLP